MNDLISRQAAIDAINKIAPVDTEYDCTLLDRVDVRCVLSDLPSAQPEPFMVTIDHELTKDEVERLKQSMSNTPIVLFPSVQPEIVRCKDCKYFEPDLIPIPYFEGDGVCCHEHWKSEEVGFEVKEIDFCSYGERKEDEEDSNEVPFD